MFCNQCEQTAKGVGCIKIGVCGKTPSVATLQDLLLYTLMELSSIVLECRKFKITYDNIDVFTIKSIFSTLTNVNFDDDRLIDFIKQSVIYRNDLINKGKKAGATFKSNDNFFSNLLSMSKDELLKQGEKVGLNSYPSDDEDILSLKHTVLFGIKGISAYADHAQILGQKNKNIYEYVYKALAYIQKPDISKENWIKLVLECGDIAFKAMELLDKGNINYYGHPVPIQVPLGQKKGKAILVSGHDLLDLELLLKQSANKGINIYTHGEMLPAHGYPKLKKYPHFYGHYGTAWQNQKKEFDNFPGSILMTTNCIQKPKESYKNNIFTSGVAGWPEVKHVNNSDFKVLIDRALALPGFQENVSSGEVTVGFARKTVISIADKLVNAVKNGDIKHIFLIGGCDGIKTERNYYTEIVNEIPDDCIILTLGCGKYKFFNKKLGNIKGIPRLLDIGQCNDTYSAVQIVLALSKATNIEINDLPLSIILSWYEQKAVCVLLALLNLGIKNIRIGPSLPVFITSNVLEILIENFNLMPTTTVKEDLKAILI